MEMGLVWVAGLAWVELGLEGLNLEVFGFLVMGFEEVVELGLSRSLVCWGSLGNETSFFLLSFVEGSFSRPRKGNM